jgi:hypothetical protein
MVAPVAADELTIEVSAVRLTLRPGAPSWLTDRVTAVGNWIEERTPLGEWMRDQTAVLAEERMYSESLLVQPSDGGHVLWYYMETEEMDQLYDAFESSTDWMARFTKWVLPRIVVPADADRFLDPPLESDATVLVHAVDPRRG